MIKTEQSIGLKQIANASQRYGSDQNFVIAGGGNTSFKTDEYIWVKASGVALETITETGFVCLNRQKLAAISHAELSTNATEREAQVKAMLELCIEGDKTKRPSVETSLHDLLKYNFVVHTHPTLINGLLCAQNSQTIIKQLFGNEVLYIPYTDPGFVLFKVVETEVLNYESVHKKSPEVIFLENHGIFVAGDTIAQIDAIYDTVMGKLNDAVKPPITFEHGSTKTIEHQGYFGNKVLKLRTSPLITDYTTNAESWQNVSIPFTPDNIVYCKSAYIFTSKGTDTPEQLAQLAEIARNFEKEKGYAAKIIGIQGVGLLAIEESEKGADIVLDVFEDMIKISRISTHFGGPRFMTKAQIAFIDNWEVENYRRKMAKNL